MRALFKAPNRGAHRSSLLEAIRQFAGDSRGNVAILFSVASIALVALMGGAVDFHRASLTKAEMQNVLDATALMLAKEAATTSADQLEEKAVDYFNAQFDSPMTDDVTVSLEYLSGVQELTLSASTAINTVFIGLVGIDTLAFASSATAEWGTKGLQVALVLDNTGSMGSHAKLVKLKDATHNFLNKLEAAAQEDGDVYVSIVPFAKDVNFGSAYYDESWLDWTPWDAEYCKDYKDDKKDDKKSKDKKKKKKKKDDDSSDDDSSDDDSDDDGGECVVTNHNTWNGCITDRGNDSGPAAGAYDTNVVTPDPSNAPTLYIAEQYSPCPKPVMGLNYNWSAMSTLIDSMTAGGNTNQGLGLQVGWLSLTGGGPFTVPPLEPDTDYGQAIVLLTDGLNTENRWYTNQAQVDARQQLTCDNAKAAEVTIYTIQVNTNGDPTSTLLQNCASSPDKFYLLTSAGEILSTLNEIAAGLENIYLAD